jgi:hypothetical protein
VDKGAQNYQSRHREQQIQSVLKRAQQLGLQIFQLEDKPRERYRVVSGKVVLEDDSCLGRSIGPTAVPNRRCPESTHGSVKYALYVIVI